MPDMGNEEITGINHFSVCFGDSESGMHRRIKGIEGFIEAARTGGVHAGVIGLDMDEADMGMKSLCLGECAKGEAVECAMVSDEEFGYTVFGDMMVDGSKKVGV